MRQEKGTVPAEAPDVELIAEDTEVETDLEDLPATDRDAIRRLREAGRDAIREARDAAKDASRQGREALRETVRQVREAEREALRQLRARQRDADGPGADDTRTRIQRIALELFTERGYEATSLREIAEHLGVTKAALYYHFKTKDEIVDSYVQDRVASIDELLNWAYEQPRTDATRREFLERYSEMLYAHGHHLLMKFFERNQSSMNQHKAGIQMRDKVFRMMEVLCPAGASLPDQIRCSLAIFALHSTWFTIRDPSVDEDQRRQAALVVALDLMPTDGAS